MKLVFNAKMRMEVLFTVGLWVSAEAWGEKII